MKKDGTLWTWGRNEYGQLGDGTNTSRSTPVQVLDQVIAVSLGYYHTVALRADGTVWTWGYNYSGQLGLTTTGNNVKEPTQVMDRDHIALIEAGGDMTAAISEDGALYVCGYGYYGDGNSAHSNGYLNQVRSLPDMNGIDLGPEHALIVKKDGSLWSWGKNRYYELGDYTDSVRTSPVELHLGRVKATFKGDGIGGDSGISLDIPWDDKYLYGAMSKDMPELLTAGLVMSEDAYGNHNGLRDFGFSIVSSSSSTGIDEPGYVIGYRATYDFDTPHVEVVMAIRGSYTSEDWITNLKAVTDGFAGPANYCYDKLKEAKTSIANALRSNGISVFNSNTKYFFTGHSMGGACAGKMGAWAIKDGIVNPDNTYVFTYAAPYYYAPVIDALSVNAPNLSILVLSGQRSGIIRI